MANFENTTHETLITGTSAADYVENYGGNVTISTGNGDDTVYNIRNYYYNDDDNDIYSAEYVSINTGAGNDSVYNDDGDWCTINTGAGNDSYYGDDADRCTINTGDGNDLISLSSVDDYDSEDNVIIYKSGDGNDTIYGFDGDDTLSISGGEYSTTKSGSDVIVTVDDGKISLIGASSLSAVNIKGTKSTNSKIITNTTPETLITGTSEADSIHNKGFKVTISTGNGDDYVYSWGDDCTINTGAGNDSVYNYKSRYSTIKTGAGNDSVFNELYASLTSINTGDGNDSVENYGDYCTINTGEGNDSVYNYRYYCTINTGAGNDEVYNNYGGICTINTGAGNDLINLGSRIYGNVIIYNSGDGNDTIYCFDGYDTLLISGGSYSTAKSGDDIIVNVDNGKISLIGAASLSKVNIKGTKTSTPSTETNKWTISGTTATFGTSSKTLVTVSGVKSTSELSVNGKVITVAKSALNASKVTVSGDYNLALANDVDKTSKTSKDWSYVNSTATYNQTNTAYYSLAGDKKSISFNKATSKTLVTVKGVKSASGLSLSGKTVTVGASSLNKKTVTISDGYTLKIANGVATPQATSASWSYKNNAATYKAASTSAGYSISSDGKSITYSKAKTASTLATISGVKSADGIKIKNKVITVPNSIIGSSKNVTLNNNGNGYQFVTSVSNKTVKGGANKDAITSKGSNLSIVVGTNNDTVKIAGSNTTINGGKGNDVISLSSAAKNNVIIYDSGDGSDILYGFDENDTLKIAKGKAATSTSGNDVIFTVGKGKITVKGAADKTFSYSDANGTKTYSTVPTSSEPYTIKGAGITLSSSYSEEKFYVEDDAPNGSVIETIDASAVNKSGDKFKIKGNDKANKIIASKAGSIIDGGKGKISDTLVGGKGADVFTYYSGDGNDVITNYSANDTIKIAKGVVSSIWTDREDVIMKVGDGKITVKDANETRITYIENNIEYGCLNGNKTFSISKDKDGTNAKLSVEYWKDTFDVTEFGNKEVGNAIFKIDAFDVRKNLKITGNDKANEILCGKGNMTLIGGAGDDTYYGNDGTDVFVYNNGDGEDYIVDYNDEDKIQLIGVDFSSGNSKVENGDVVIKFVGTSGKIRLANAANKTITFIDEKGKPLRVEDPSSWFLADDDDFSTDNQLSSIVKSNVAADYSFINTPTTLDKGNNLIAYAKK